MLDTFGGKMAVHVRLSRHGSTHRPFYHIVAADHRKARDGRFIERLGYYDPNKNPSIINLKEDRLQYWFGHGAHLTDTVKKLVKVQNIKLERNNAK